MALDIKPTVNLMIKMSKLLKQLLDSKLPDDLTLESFMLLYSVGGVHYAAPLLKKILDDSAISKFAWFLVNMYGDSKEIALMHTIYTNHMNSGTISKNNIAVRRRLIDNIKSRLSEDDADALKDVL